MPQEVVRRLLDHTSHTMTAVYARLADTTIREQWERAQKINIRGEPVDTSVDGPLADAEWMKQNLARAKMALPNGYCGLPLQKSCPHANACLTCPLFVTTAEFLPQHRKQLDDTRALITRAETDGHTRLAEMNRTVETNLLTIITTLEPDQTTAVAPHIGRRNMLRRRIIRCALTTATTSSPPPNAVAPTPSNAPAQALQELGETGQRRTIIADRRPRRRLPLMALRPDRTARPTPPTDRQIPTRPSR